MLGHPSCELALVDAMPLLDRLGAGKVFVFSHAVGHDEAPLDLFEFVGWAKAKRAHRLASRSKMVGTPPSSRFARRRRLCPPYKSTSMPRLVGVFLHLEPGDGAVVHLVGTVGKPERADSGIVLGETGLVRDAGAAERLDRVVDDLERHVGGGDLDHGDLALRGLVADPVHHVGGLEAQKPRHLDVGAGFTDALLPPRMLDDLLAERAARHQPAHHLLQRLLGLADGAHAVVDAARTETALRDLEAAALAE